MLGATLALAVVVLGAGPSPDPVALVGQLGSPKYALRESAESGLAKLGREALPALKAAKESKDPEIRTRASALQARIENSLLLEATPVSFDFRDVPVDQAIRSINEQTGLALNLVSEEGSPFSSRRLTLRSDRPLPFWKAIDALCEAGQLHHVPGEALAQGQPNGSFLLYDGLASAEEPVFDSGPFRAHLTSIHYQSEIQLGGKVLRMANGTSVVVADQPGRLRSEPFKQFYLQLMVSAEPRLAITQNGPIKLTSAVDDRGLSLMIPPKSGTFQHSAGYYGMNPNSLVRLRLDLAYPETPGKTLKSIQGLIPLIVTTRKPDAMDIKLATGLGQTFRSGETDVIVRDSRPAQPNQPAKIELTIKTFGPVNQPIDTGEGEPLAYRPDSPQQQIEVFDDKGQTLPWFPSGTYFNGEETRLTIALIPRAGAPTIPATIRYHEIIRTASEVAFEFRDVPLP